MNRNIKQISLVVDNYDKAIDFYTKKLGFRLIEDTKLSDSKRWVLVKPNGNSDFCLLLAKAANTNQKQAIGNQTGGRVFLFMNTDDFDRDYILFKKNGVEFVRQPKTESYGKVAVFKDLYGNLWDLIQPTKPQKEPFFTTGLIELKNGLKEDIAIQELKQLAIKTREEKGNITFNIQQLTEQKQRFIIWECFTDEAAFKEHLQSKHLSDFLEKEMFTFIKGYQAKKI